jgi:murein peptide amidase A
MQRLGRNHGGYFGETIDIHAVLRDIEETARQHGWSSETLLPNPEINLLALRRPALSSPASAAVRDSTGPVPRVYLSAGIHGDEPAGPLAVRQLLRENRWPSNLEVWLCPCLNPTGFALNRRENDRGIDLNRQYRSPVAAEIIAHTAWLKRQPEFDCSLCLHEDWEAQGFYVYELNPGRRPALAESIIDRVAPLCPIDTSEVIEGRPARQGIIRPEIDPRTRPDWPEAFFLVTHKSPLSCTLEAPSDYPLPVRVAALVAGVTAALEQVSARGLAGA